MSSSSNRKDSFKIALENCFIKQFDFTTFEDYEPIARSGFSQVVRAYSKTLREHIVLKCLHSADSENEFYKNCTNEVNYSLSLHYLIYAII